MRKLTLIGLLVLCNMLTILSGCHEQNKNKISPAELMKSREIKKVSEAEILQKGTLLGNEIQLSLDSLVKTKVHQGQTVCEITNWRELDSLMLQFKAEIKHLHRNTTALTDLESQLLEAYQYNLENDLPTTASVQKMDERFVLFAHPMDKRSDIYMYCMDSARKTSAEMWGIKIPIKEIIQRL